MSHSIKDSESLIRSIWLHYVFFQPHAALEQLRAGFCETLQIALITCTHPNKLYGILVASDAFDPTESDLIDDVMIKYSEEGSNNKKKEETLILFWTEFITSCAVEGQYFAVACSITSILTTSRILKHCRVSLSKVSFQSWLIKQLSVHMQ